jgi:hypothetical protein
MATHIEHWDDERAAGNGIIVTLNWGFSFDETSHEGVQGFDTVTEARRATRKKWIFPCGCTLCRQNLTNQHGGRIDDDGNEGPEN